MGTKFYRIDLAPFFGEVLIKGGRNLRTSAREDGSSAKHLTGFYHEGHTRAIQTREFDRYLISDAPFAVCGKTWEEWNWAAQEVPQ